MSTTKKQEWVKPTILKSKIHYCKEGNFFWAKWSENANNI